MSTQEQTRKVRYGTEIMRRLVERALLDGVLLDPTDVQVAVDPSTNLERATELMDELHADRRLDTECRHG